MLVIDYPDLNDSRFEYLYRQGRNSWRRHPLAITEAAYRVCRDHGSEYLCALFAGRIHGHWLDAIRKASGRDSDDDEASQEGVEAS